MSQKPETKFRAKVRPRLDAIENSWWESIQQKTINGTPDIIGCIKGRFIAIELKASEKSVVSPLQKHKLEEIVKAGGISHILHPGNCEEVLTSLESL